MAQSLLSTKEVAGLLNVAETTIKRWADENELACIKTPGGHRKFDSSVVLAFAESRQYPLTGLVPPPMTSVQRDRLTRGVQTKDHTMLAKVFMEEALQGDREGLYELLTFVHTHQIGFSTIADDIIRPAMTEIGRRWSEGILEVNQEHLASQAVLEALVRFGPNLHRKPSHGRKAVCSGVEGELHSLGLRCVAYGLEGDGWSVDMLGANTPFESLHAYVDAVRPDLVCLSSTLSRKRKDHLDAISSLTKLVHRWKGAVVVGGLAAEHLTSTVLGCDHVARSLRDTLSFSRDRFQLKPGPKPRTKQPATRNNKR